MVLKGDEVHKYVSIQHCHNFLYMMHLWKIAYDVIIVSIEMLKCYIGFYLNCATAWDARISTRLNFILSLNEMFGMNHTNAKKGLRSSNSISFYENVLFLNELKFLEVEIKC